MIWLVFWYAALTALIYRGNRIIQRQKSPRWRIGRATSFLLSVLWPLNLLWHIVRHFLRMRGIMTEPEDMFPRR